MVTNNINIIKRSLFFILLSFIMVNAQAQTGLNFQGVARTSNNVILSSQAITIKLSILQGSSTGTVEYTETRKVTTNAQGLFTAVIGDTGAIITLGNFTTINWKLSPKFLKIEMDPAAGTNFITMGTTQFQYVAYAQFAKSVDAENIVGVVPVARGGTGATNLSIFKLSLAIDKINNTADADKPISVKVQAALDLKSSLIDTSKYTKQTYTDSSLLTKLKISDTAAMLSSRIARDTLNLSKRITSKANTTDVASELDLKLNAADTSKYTKQTYTDSSLLTKLNISDTAAMLSSRIARDTLNLSNRINLKANATYVASELDLKLNAADTSKYTKQTYTDSSLLTKLKISDTAAMLSSRIARDTLNLSKRITSKANTTDVASGLALKENTSNKSIAVDLGGTTPSDILFPTQKAVKDYVTANNASGGISDGSIITIKIADDAVTDAKINTVSGSKVIGNITGNAATATLATIATTASLAGNITATANTTLTSLSNLNTVGIITSGVWSGTEVAIEKGGTGATTASAARTNLGLVIGIDVQAPLVAGTDYLAPVSLTTTGASGASTFTSNTLNIPTYTLAGLGGISLSGVSATAPLSYNSVTGVFSIPIATTSANGYLSSTDWTTFNAKQTALTAGSGISISAGTISATGLTTSNLSSTAGITNAQLAGSIAASKLVGTDITTVGTLANLTVTNPIAGSITGNAATATTATTAGTASTATKLATPKNINGVAFDGSQDINISASADAGTLTGTTLKSTVTGSSLTSVGTLANLTVTNSIAGSITGNAATATLATNVTTNANLTGIVTSNGNTTNIANLAINDARISSVSATKITGTLPVLNGGTGSTTQNFVDLTTIQNIAGEKTFSSDIFVNGITMGQGGGGISSNTANGYISLFSNMTGFNNTAIGNASLYSNTMGYNNTANGYASLYSNTTGYNNTAIGNASLYANTTGDGNTAIGYNADVGSYALYNATAIGNGAIVNNSNTIQLGNGDVTNVKTNGTITAGAVTYPELDGTANQVLTTNGSGVASFVSIPTLNQNTTGSAATLTTARNINGVAFDGSQDINISASADAGTLTGTTLKSTVTGSSLTSVGTLTNLTVTKAIAGSITGNAATATLATIATTVTTNANLTGIVTSVGNTTDIANLAINDVKIASVSATKITGTLPVEKGGTGLTSAGSNGQVLTSTGSGTLIWTTPSGGGDVHTIGETYGGGIVFYVYDNGKHGLIAATSDKISGVRWYGGTNTNTRARADGVGAGLKNTVLIIANQGALDVSAFAATFCNEYSVNVGGVTYGDWYLPSKHELDLLYLKKSVVGGFRVGFYWSSTEFFSDEAWAQDLSDGQKIIQSKDAILYVRAIRAF